MSHLRTRRAAALGRKRTRLGASQNASTICTGMWPLTVPCVACDRVSTCRWVTDERAVLISDWPNDQLQPHLIKHRINLGVPSGLG